MTQISLKQIGPQDIKRSQLQLTRPTSRFTVIQALDPPPLGQGHLGASRFS